MLYHVNKATGETGLCKATIRNCPLGGGDEHFTSEEAARAYYESTMAAGSLAAKKKDGRSTRGDWPDLELYRGKIQDFSEVFVHPQGKIAFNSSRYSDRLTVMKNGKSASTSGTLADMRAGRGAWKQIKTASGRLPSPEEYSSNYSAEEATVTVAPGKKVPARGLLTPLQQANVDAGYPKESPYDPSNNVISQGHYSEPDNYYDTSAILPLNQRGNPFKLGEMKSFDKLRFWNRQTPGGKEYADSVFEVWEDGEGHYKAVVTSGKQIGKIGSKAYFEHDQSQARMPGSWTLIGGFEPIEGGGIVGTVPSYAMPIYTYK